MQAQMKSVGQQRKDRQRKKPRGCSVVETKRGTSLRGKVEEGARYSTSHIFFQGVIQHTLHHSMEMSPQRVRPPKIC